MHIDVYIFPMYSEMTGPILIKLSGNLYISLAGVLVKFGSDRMKSESKIAHQSEPGLTGYL